MNLDELIAYATGVINGSVSLKRSPIVAFAQALLPVLEGLRDRPTEIVAPKRKVSELELMVEIERGNTRTILENVKNTQSGPLPQELVKLMGVTVTSTGTAVHLAPSVNRAYTKREAFELATAIAQTANSLA